MMKRHLLCAWFLAVLLAGVACNGQRSAVDTGAEEDTSVAGPLYSVSRPAIEPERPLRSGPAADPVVIHDCRLTVIDKQDVPCQREGVILVIGTEIQPGEKVPTDRVVTATMGDQTRSYKRLKEDDVVEAGQLLAQLDDRLARDDWSIKNGKLAAAKADLAAAEKTRDEAKSRYDTQAKLRSAGNAAALEEVRATKLTWERYVYEAESKREAVKLAELERNQAQTILNMHEIRAAIPGVVKTIYKKRGEAVKSQEPLFQIQDLSKLRIEGLVEVEYVPRLRKGMTAVVEPARSDSPELTLLGHLQEVTGVAVNKDAKHIVSASDDGSVRVWERSSQFEKRVFWHPAPVKTVACTPPGAKANWCLSGGSDGIARIWDLDSSSDQPLRELSGQHKGPIICVAFSPDAEWCATGGEDREICLWKSATGELLYRFPAGHRAAVTSLHLTPRSMLVSAGRDNTVRVWELSTKEAKLVSTIDRRSGDLAHPGVSPDGQKILLDQGKALRLLTLSDKRTEGILENAGEATHFSTFALFSPDARLILTAGTAEGTVQLWRAPTTSTRPHELRQWKAREHAVVTCAAFAPDGKFAVTGTKDRQILVWPMPASRDIEQQITAEVTLVEQSVESSARQVRVWAEVKNPNDPGRRLLPGTTVTLAIYPR